MTTNYHDRIRNSLNRWGKRQGRRAQKTTTTTPDLSGWTQQELMLAPEVESGISQLIKNRLRPPERPGEAIKQFSPYTDQGENP